MRLSRILTIIVGAFLIGVVVLIVVEVANYGGRAPAEVTRDKRTRNLAPLKQCPQDEPLGSEGGPDPGTKGKTVPPDPVSALICRWTEEHIRGHGFHPVKTEVVLRGRRDLNKLTDALNSLPPAVPLPEGEYACPEGEPFAVLIGLRYGGSSEAQVAIGPAVCGGYAVVNLQDETEYGATTGLLRLLDRVTAAAAEPGPGSSRARRLR